MTDYVVQAQILKSLAHPVRLQILDLLRHSEECVCHMEAALKRRQAYISQQLMTLRDAGLVEARKDGLNVYYALADPAALKPLLDAILGVDAGEGHGRVQGCPCPKCTAPALVMPD